MINTGLGRNGAGLGQNMFSFLTGGVYLLLYSYSPVRQWSKHLVFFMIVSQLFRFTRARGFSPLSFMVGKKLRTLNSISTKPPR